MSSEIPYSIKESLTSYFGYNEIFPTQIGNCTILSPLSLSKRNIARYKKKYGGFYEELCSALIECLKKNPKCIDRYNKVIMLDSTKLFLEYPKAKELYDILFESVY